VYPSRLKDTGKENHPENLDGKGNLTWKAIDSPASKDWRKKGKGETSKAAGADSS
jgi:hypothetical protein